MKYGFGMTTLYETSSDNTGWFGVTVRATMCCSVTLGILRKLLHSGKLTDLTSQLTGPVVSRGLEILQEVKTGTIFW